MIYCAPYVLPVDTSPIVDGAVLIEQDQIVAVGSRQLICSTYPTQIVTEFPRHILMPGLVNCHTHLELSVLENKIPTGLSFVDWLQKVIELRSLYNEGDIKASIEKGIKRLIATGTTCVGDVSSFSFSKELLDKAGLRGIVFLEVVGFQSEKAEDILAQLRLKLKKIDSGKGLVRAGIAPHAPYSVSPALFQQITACCQNDYKISIHLAESQEEVLFINKGAGPLYELLLSLGKWDASWQPAGCFPVQYLHRLQALPPGTAAVHLNYLEPDDYQILTRQQIQIITCPLSNRWLGHKNLHLNALYKKGVNVGLGSDSLASNDDLNLFNEMNLLAKENPWLDCEKIIKIATVGGAKVLGLESQIGSLTAGKQADMIALAAPADLSVDSLAEYVIQEVTQVEGIVVAGNLIFNTIKNGKEITSEKR